jgi:hypothetical protein
VLRNIPPAKLYTLQIDKPHQPIKKTWYSIT